MGHSLDGGFIKTWVVVYLEGKKEIWEEFARESEAHNRARALSNQVVKVVERRKARD